MNEALVERWNKTVNQEDLVYILGDFAFKRHIHWINALKGKKILIVGNHDRMPKIALDQFHQVVGTCRSSPGILQTTIAKQYVTMCHFPMHSWNGSCYSSFMLHGHCHGTKREFDPTQPLILGRDLSDEENDTLITTSRRPEYQDGLSCGVDVDIWEFTPVPWEVLRAKLTARIPAWRARREHYANTPQRDNVAQLAAENASWRARIRDTIINN